MKTAMVILASEQLWPNLDGFLQWNAKISIDHLFLYYTKDLKRSKAPARKLELLVREIAPRCQTHPLVEPGGAQPADVTLAIERWQLEVQADRWILNATGGTKIMAAGVFRFVGEADCTIIYRELDGHWYELRRGSDDRSIASHSIESKADLTDRIPVKQLLRLQAEIPEDAVIETHNAKKLPVFEIARAGLKCDWDWSLAFADAGVKAGDRGGFLFEQFVAAGLIELGVQNLACNVLVKSADGKPLQELDIVCNTAGRIVVIDCKLRSEEEEQVGRVEAVTSQIRQAATTRRSFGGLAAAYVMVRPNRVFAAPERALASANNIQVIDATDCARLFSELATVCSIASCPSWVGELEHDLQNSLDSGATRVFAAEHIRLREVQAASAGRGVFHLEELMRQRGQDWLAYYVDSAVHFRARTPSDCDKLYVKAKVIKILGGFGTLLDLRFSSNGRNCSFKLEPRSGQLQRLSLLLERFIGGSLLSD